MKKEQAALVKARKEVAKELRNAERKKRRLRDRAKLLSDGDLVAVLEMRAEQKVASDAGGSSPARAVRPAVEGCSVASAGGPEAAEPFASAEGPTEPPEILMDERREDEA